MSPRTVALILSISLLVSVGELSYSLGKHDADRWYAQHPVTRTNLVKWEETQDNFDDFRNCNSIFSQREDESQADFAARIPSKPLPPVCILYRRKPQAAPLDASLFGFASIFIGGSFDGKLKPEESKVNLICPDGDVCSWRPNGTAYDMITGKDLTGR
jgi:hypothetical protein